MFSSPTGFFLNRLSRPYAEPADKRHPTELPTLGHAVAGVMAGWTVSFVAAPIEHVKARLQIQYAAEKSKRLYSGPIDCTKKIVRASSSSLDASLAVSVLTLCLDSTVLTVSAVSTTACPPHCFFVHSSSSGGDPTISSHGFYHLPPTSPHHRSISGPGVSRRRCFGWLRTHLT